MNLLLTQQDVAEYSAISGNIEPSKWLPQARFTQQFIIKPLIGWKLYDKIESDYIDDDLAGIFKEIHQKLKFIIAYSIASEYLGISYMQSYNAGVYSVEGNNKIQKEKKDVDFLVNNQRMKAETYIKDLKDFLCKNKENLKDYEVDFTNCGCGSQSGKKVSLISGWNL